MTDVLILPREPHHPVSIGPGWVPLVQHLVDDLEQIAPHLPLGVIGQKLNELRFSVDLRNVSKQTEAHVRARIQQAAVDSRSICEVCGARHDRHPESARCDAHWSRFEANGEPWPPAEWRVRPQFVDGTDFIDELKREFERDDDE